MTIKTSYVRMTAYGARASALHMDYIQRDGVQADGSRGVLYGPDGPVAATELQQPREGERHQFRIIVSPEDARDLNLTDYVRRLMRRIGCDVDRDLEWAAVNHYNTRQPHAHVVVRGVDRDGREVRFPRSYVSNGMRWRAQELATEELGPRSEQEIRRERWREVTQERLTSLDRELQRRAVGGVRVDLAPADGRGVRIDRESLVARLEHLQEMGLAHPQAPDQWLLRTGWDQTLRELGERGDIIKQMHAAVSGDPAHYRIVREGEPLLDEAGTRCEQPLVGRVVAKGLADESKGTFFAVVESPGGSAYHVPIGTKTVEAVRVGDLVRLETTPSAAVLPIDRELVARAMRDGDTYLLDSSLAGDSGSDRASRRLRTLEQWDLVKRVAANRWQIPRDLPEKLERRARTLPGRLRLTVQRLPLNLRDQVTYRGPVWLDTVGPESLAPYGWGRQVAEALEQRGEVLARLNILPHDPERLARLARLERDVVVEGFAKRSSQRPVEPGLERFEGVVQAFRSPAGSTYAIVSNGHSFVALASAEALRNRGKRVDLRRLNGGDFVVHERSGPELA